MSIAAAFMVVLWVAVAKVPVAWNEDCGDSRYFQFTGLQILDGAKPYRDFWDVKPPGIFYLAALGGLLSETSLVQFALLDGLFNLLALLVASWMIGSLASRPSTPSPRSELGTAGWLSLGLAAVLSSHAALTVLGNLTESYLLLPETLSVAAGLGLLRRSDGESSAVTGRDAFLAGVFGALAGWIRPTGLAGIGALELTWLATGRWRLGFAALAGLGIGMLPGIALFWHWDLLGQMFHATVVFPLWESGVGRAPLLKKLSYLWPLAWPAILVFAWLIWAVSTRLLGRQSKIHFHDRHATVLLWVALDLAGALLPGQHRQHYFIPLSISLSVAALLPLSAGLRGDRTRGLQDGTGWMGRLLAAATAAWILAAAGTELRVILSARPVEESRASWMEVVRFLRDRVSPGEPIYVPDYAPTIYVLTRTRPTSPWVYVARAHTDSLPTEATREAAFREALRGRPRFIVSTARTPVKRAVSILNRRAAQVFACSDWVVWRRLDASRGERLLVRWPGEGERPAGARMDRPIAAANLLADSAVKAHVGADRAVEFQLPADSSSILLVSVAFRDSARPVHLEVQSEGQTSLRQIGGAGPRARIESFELAFPRDGRLRVRARFSDGTPAPLDRIELSAVAKPHAPSDLDI